MSEFDPIETAINACPSVDVRSLTISLGSHNELKAFMQVRGVAASLRAENEALKKRVEELKNAHKDLLKIDDEALNRLRNRNAELERRIEHQKHLFSVADTNMANVARQETVFLQSLLADAKTQIAALEAHVAGLVEALEESGCQCQAVWKTGEDHYICKRCRALDQAGQGGAKWPQPIETAPLDGTPILATYPWLGIQRPVVVTWGGEKHPWWIRYMERQVIEGLTHWMPLPVELKAAVEAEKGNQDE